MEKENTEENDAIMKATELKKPLTSYLLFLEEHREKVREENGGSAASVVKILAEKWRALTPEERKKYDDLAKESKEAYGKKLAEMGLTLEDIKRVESEKKKTKQKKRKKLEENENKEANENDLEEEELTLQLGRIKRLIRLDPAFQKPNITESNDQENSNVEKMMRMSSDAATMITKTTELFIAHLAQCVWNHVSKNLKRKTLTANDLRDIINTNPRFDFLRAPMRTAFSEQNSTDDIILSLNDTKCVDSTSDDAVSEKKKRNR